MALTVPPEICSIICRDPVLARYDLHNLCFVARSFRAEAERLLYTAVSLRGIRRINAFCISLARRPHLALFLKKLVLYMPPQMDFEAKDLGRIVHALNLSVNLKDLSTLQDDIPGFPHKPGDATQSWILDGHDFRLERFSNSYFHSCCFSHFFKDQPMIKTLTMRGKEIANIVDAELPSLVNLDSYAAVVQEFNEPSRYKRSFERLQFNFEKATDVEELATLVALTQFKNTLKSVSITRKEGGAGVDVAVLAACVSAQLPDLKYLRIMDYTTKPETYYVPFFPFPMRFTQIETMIIRPPTRAYDDSTGDTKMSCFLQLRTAEGCRGAAERIMAALPTLTRLILVGEQNHEFKRDKDSNEILEQDLEVLDDEDWMKVL